MKCRPAIRLSQGKCRPSEPVHGSTRGASKMRQFGTAAFGVALVAAAVGFGAKSFFVTDAAALVTNSTALQQTAAAAIALRFPTQQEMFGNVIAGTPNGILVAPDPKSTRSAALFPCAGT